MLGKRTVVIFQSRNTFALLADYRVWDDGFIKDFEVMDFETLAFRLLRSFLLFQLANLGSQLS
ncbi:hypothetical protein AK95_05460 [Paenibacillus sp. LC231]|nr:hypothetical protein AK95_05460 [Paenibacillus sp. LC231]